MTALLTTAEAAKQLKLSTDAVCGLIARGRLRAINVGLGQRKPRWRISVEALELFLASRSTSPRPPAAKRKRSCENVIEFFR